MPDWPAAIFFDFDGVIVNSEPLHFAAIRDVMAEENIPLAEDEYYKELIGFDDRGAIRHMFAKHGRELSPQSLQHAATRKMQITRERITDNQYQALPGVEETVRGLASHYPLAICSGALREEIQLMLEGIHLRDFFKLIVAAEDVAIGKPNPEGYLKTVRLMSELMGGTIAPKDCLIIEDAPTVIRSTRAVGFQTLGVATSYPLSELSDAHHAVAELTPSEILKQIPQLIFGK